MIEPLGLAAAMITLVPNRVEGYGDSMLTKRISLDKCCCFSYRNVHETSAAVKRNGGHGLHAAS